MNTLMSGVEWWYQHDGAPYHAADSTQEFLQDRVPGFFTRTGALPYSDVRAHWLHVEWPPNSPDISPVENKFGEVLTRVAELTPKTSADLDRVFRQVWREATTPEKCRKLFESMPARLRAVISAQGKPTRY